MLAICRKTHREKEKIAAKWKQSIKWFGSFFGSPRKREREGTCNQAEEQRSNSRERCWEEKDHREKTAKRKFLVCYGLENSKEEECLILSFLSCLMVPEIITLCYLQQLRRKMLHMTTLCWWHFREIKEKDYALHVDEAQWRPRRTTGGRAQRPKEAGLRDLKEQQRQDRCSGWSPPEFSAFQCGRWAGKLCKMEA